MCPILRLSFPALIAVGFCANPALAQRPVYIPPDVKGFQAQQMRQQAAQRAARAAAATPTPSAYYRPAGPSIGGIPVVPEAPEVRIAITPPTTTNLPASLAIRGPDGELRTFPVQGGQNALNNRVIVVHPGQTVTIQLLPAPPK